MSAEPASTGVPAGPDPVDVSEPPALLWLGLALPAFATLVYMLGRIFAGRWIDDDPDSDRVGP